MEIRHLVVVDSKDLYTKLFTCRKATDRLMRTLVNLIRYQFQTQNVNRIIWVPGIINLADTITKPNSPLTQILQLLIYYRKLSSDFEKHTIKIL